MSNPGCILKRTSINKIGGNGNNYNDGTAHDRKNISLELVITMSYPPQLHSKCQSQLACSAG